MQILTTVTPLTNQDQEGCRLNKYYIVRNIIRIKHDEWEKKVKRKVKSRNKNI